MKKVKKGIIIAITLLIAAIQLLSPVTSTFAASLSDDLASISYPSDYDPEWSLKAKLLYYAIVDCTRQNQRDTSSRDEVMSGKLWANFGSDGSAEGRFLVDVVRNNGGGSTSDIAKINCGKQEDAVSLINAAAKVWGQKTGSIWGVNKKDDMLAFNDVMCGVWEGVSSNGILGPEHSNVYCGESNKFRVEETATAKNFLKRLVERAGVHAPDTMTKAEKFYLYNWSLRYGACAENFSFTEFSGELHEDFNGSDTKVIVTGFNADGSMKTTAVRSNGNKSSLSAALTVKENYVWQSQTGTNSGNDYDMTCEELIDSISILSEATRWAQRVAQRTAVKSCESYANSVVLQTASLTDAEMDAVLTQATQQAEQSYPQGVFYYGDGFPYGSEGAFATPEDRRLYEITNKAQELLLDLQSTAESNKYNSEMAKLGTLWTVDEEDGLGAITCNVEGYENITPPPPPEEDQPTCTSSAGAIGWIACPVQDALTSASKTLYGRIAKFLKIDVGFLGTGADDTDNNNKTYSAWGTFRDIANIIFVILFLVVIIAQISGINAANYGIKKILPRLITSAILINLSFIICQLAVDLSNILGSSIAGFLATLVQGSGSGGIELVITALVGTIGGITIVGFAATAGGGIAIVVPILLFLLSVLLAILLVFVILAVRQAAVIILVAIAPLAFACYILPNTESLFRKWFDMFKAMLIIYPVCSAVIGFGLLAHNILMGTSFINNLIAVAAAVVPFFALPSLIKGSINGLGQVGAKISGFAQRGSSRIGEMRKTNQDKITGASKIGLAKTPATSWALGRRSRASAVEAMKAQAAQRANDATNKNFLAGTSPAAATLYSDQVAGMSYADRTARLEALSRKASANNGKLSAQEIAEGTALAKVADNKQMRSALTGSTLSNDVTKAWTEGHMSGNNFGKTNAEDPALAATLKSVAKGESSATALSKVRKNTIADYSPEQISKLSAKDISDVINNTQQGGGSATDTVKVLSSIKKDTSLYNAMSADQRAAIDVSADAIIQRNKATPPPVASSNPQTSSDKLTGDSGPLQKT